MVCDLTETWRSLVDKQIAKPSLYGLNPYQVSIVTITNTGVDIFGNGGTRSRTDFRLTIGPDGYSADLNGPNQDGYVNPHVEQVSSKDIFLSGGLLTDKDYKIGPITYPYDTYETGASAGLNWLFTNPAIQPNQNLQLFFKITGPAFPNGAYFRRKWSLDDNNIVYWLFVENSAEIPGP